MQLIRRHKRHPRRLPAFLFLLTLALFGTGRFSARAAAPAVYYSDTDETEASEEPGWALSALSVRTNNLDEAPLFAGGEVKFLANQASERQQLCGVFRSADGKVLVVDGGVAENAPHLLDVLKAYGGTVDAWLITHPQDDHVGALNCILREHAGEIDIQNVYFHFNELSWYGEVAPEDASMVAAICEALRTLPAERLHGFDGEALKKGEEIRLSDSLSFCAMNDPLMLSGSYAVNDSSIMYDIALSGTHVIVLGDMGPDGGDVLLSSVRLSKPQADLVVMAHHGQNGVRENFYRALSPKGCIWSTPDWLFDASPSHRKFKTADTKALINAMGITRNYCTKDGDITLR